MATQTVPYNTAMQLGTGFNSFTQTLCVNNAVVRDLDLAQRIAQSESDGEQPKQVAQSVVYKTSIINKTTDVTDEMNFTAAFAIKYDQLNVNGGGSYINTNKIKDSDVSIMVSVKVVNQTIYDHSLIKFQPIPNISEAKPQQLLEVFGDSFISGWQEGGEFLAVISIKAKNRDEAQTIAANAKIAFSQTKDAPAEVDKSADEKTGGDADKEKTKEKEKNKNESGLELKFDKIKKELAAENEVSVSVTWTGGGQDLKPREKDWDFDTMKAVALKFPDLVAKTPMRTHALLTKYTALRSFHESQNFVLPAYDKTGTYTNVLQEAYLDYKSILGSIQVLAFDVTEGTKALVVNPRSANALKQAKAAVTGDANATESAKDTPPGSDTDSTKSSATSETALTKPERKVITLPLPSIEEPFPASIEGLEEARLKCRFMMNRIIQEIDNIAIRPEIATDENRKAPYLSPFLFKMLLPLGVPLVAKSNEAQQAIEASKIQPDVLVKQVKDLKDKSTA